MTSEAPGLTIEKQRLAAARIPFLGIVGDRNHTRGFHLDRARISANDYSLRGAANREIGPYACAIDVGMNWPASRKWLAWVVEQTIKDNIKNIAEIIGSLDGKKALYWADSTGWRPERYTGDGHVSHSHIAIYRSTARDDHHLVDGWTRDGYRGATTPAPNPGPQPKPPTPAGTWCKGAYRPVLRRGSTGPHVLFLQKMIGVDYSSGPGIFGPKTEARVRWYQRMRHIPVDGVAGPQTWQQIDRM